MTDSGMADLISRAAAIEVIVSLTTFESEDELKKYVEEKACDDYYLGGLCDVIDEIKDTTAVDAVPVEWLKSKRKEALHEGMRPDEVEAVEMVLWMWQKEQEAR